MVIGEGVGFIKNDGLYIVYCFYYCCIFQEKLVVGQYVQCIIENKGYCKGYGIGVGDDQYCCKGVNCQAGIVLQLVVQCGEGDNQDGKGEVFVYVVSEFIGMGIGGFGEGFIVLQLSQIVLGNVVGKVDFNVVVGLLFFGIDFFFVVMFNGFGFVGYKVVVNCCFFVKQDVISGDEFVIFDFYDVVWVQFVEGGGGGVVVFVFVMGCNREIRFIIVFERDVVVCLLLKLFVSQQEKNEFGKVVEVVGFGMGQNFECRMAEKG